MIVLSLFDGMSCGQIALKELDMSISRYYASEIDKFAIQQTKHNFPSTIHLGDVEQWKGWNIDFSAIDLVIAGSPCQGFSFAGKQLAFDDPRSKLFFVFIDILNHIKKLNPNVKFMLENVDMKRSHMEVINRYCDIFPVNINSNLVSAQNRNRWYWTNIATKEVGLFGEVHSDIPQPKDKGIYLKDILEREVDEKYFLSDNAINRIVNTDCTYRSDIVEYNEKARPVLASDHKIARGMNVVKHQIESICVAMRGRNPDNPTGRKVGLPTKQRLEANTSGKTNCLTSVQKDNLVLQLNPSTESGGNQPYQHNRIYSDEGKSPCLDIDGRKNVYTNYRIRRLTPAECARLQTIPEWYEWIVSDTQIYKMCGNGWTVSVIMWIFSFMNVESKKIAI